MAQSQRLLCIHQPLIAPDVQLGAQLLALITIKNAERYADTYTERLVGKRVVERGIIRIPRGERRIGRAISDRKWGVGLRLVDGLRRGLQVRSVINGDFSEIS